MGLLRPDFGPVLAGEGREGRQVGLGVDQHLGDSEGNGSLKVSMTCLYWAATASGVVWAKMVETSAPAGLDRAEPSPGGDGAGEARRSIAKSKATSTKGAKIFILEGFESTDFE